VRPICYVLIAVAVLAGGAACVFVLKQRAAIHGCGNHMLSICVAARMWANDNGNRFPSELRSMSNEVITPKILICPGDRSHKRAGLGIVHA